ncbi:MAG: tRNA lysidine(34) synthetase TilS, partial [Planctomycetota bacterium]
MKNSLLAKTSRGISDLIPAEASRFIVALSGGPDSVALLSLSQAWSKGARSRPVVEALHIHHGLRDHEADRDANHCANLCARLGIPFHLVVEDAAKKSHSDSLSLETAGREIRRARFVELGKARSAPIVLTGHHGDDQAETVLGNLLRGCGLRGLRGMEPLVEIGSSGISIGRPLLKIRRVEILKYLEEIGLHAIEDSSNRSPVHRRNRLRHETVPILEKENPEIVTSLLNISEEARRRWEVLQRRIDRCLERVYIRSPRLSLPPDCCNGLEGPEIGDFLRRAIFQATGEEGGLVREHLRSLEKLVSGESRSASLLLPGNRKAIRCGGWIHIGPEENTP